MREATKHVTVLLDGQGADEMMAGYIPYYFVYLRQLRQEMTAAKRPSWPSATTCSTAWAAVMLKAKLRPGEVHRHPPADETSDFARRTRRDASAPDGTNLKTRLVEDLFHNSLPCLLRYEDKNTMRFSLEGRVPFLD